VPPPHRLLRSRIDEICLHLHDVDQPQPGLLATPTLANGAIDPNVLLERLRRRGHRPALPYDLIQALLRVATGRDDDADLIDRAAHLGTPAGDRLATWLRDGGLPPPRYHLVSVPLGPPIRYHGWLYSRLSPHRWKIEVEPPHGHHDPTGILTAAPPPLQAERGSSPILWPAILPHHRDLAAAYTLPEIAGTADADLRGGGRLLLQVADCTGHGREPFALALAYGLAARHDADRVAALDALLAATASGGLDSTATGRHLGALAEQRLITIGRTVTPLRDAATAGARLTVWRILAAALPALLRRRHPPTARPISSPSPPKTPPRPADRSTYPDSPTSPHGPDPAG
jgi:hypothetical protein